MRKFLAMLLCVMLVSGSMVYGESSAPSSWAKEGVEEIEGLYFFTNILDYKKDITRREFVKFLLPILEHFVQDKENTEVMEDMGYVEFVDEHQPIRGGTDLGKAAGWGVLSGVGNNKVDPEGLITREQVSVMLGNAISLIERANGIKLEKTSSVPSFLDKDNISSWAVDSVNAVVAMGLMQGVGSNKFDAKSNLTVEQTLLILNNLWHKIGKIFVKELDLNGLEVDSWGLYIDSEDLMLLKDQETSKFAIQGDFYTYRYFMYGLQLITSINHENILGYFWQPNQTLKVKHDGITGYTNLSEIKALKSPNVTESTETIFLNGKDVTVHAYTILQPEDITRMRGRTVTYYCDKETGEILQIFVYYPL